MPMSKASDAEEDFESLLKKNETTTKQSEDTSVSFRSITTSNKSHVTRDVVLTESIQYDGSSGIWSVVTGNYFHK